jgi:hypothetical protein
MNHLLDNSQNRNTFALVLIGLGAFFFLDQIFHFANIGGKLWPFFVIVPGLIFLSVALSGDREKSGFIFPAAIITGTGLILLYQSFTGHWESWAYIWTLYPGFVGFGLRFHGEHSGKEKEIQTGREMMRWSLVAFGAFFFLFEVIVFGGFGGWLPVVLIGGGLMPQKRMAFCGHYAHEKAKRKNDEYV